MVKGPEIVQRIDLAKPVQGERAAELSLQVFISKIRGLFYGFLTPGPWSFRLWSLKNQALN